MRVKSTCKPACLLCPTPSHFARTPSVFVFLTVVGAVPCRLGTPEYMPPEVLLGITPDTVEGQQAGDWWAFGVMMFECLLGHTPFSGTTPEEISSNVIAGRIDLATGEAAMISSAALSLIQSLLVFDPLQRMENARAANTSDFFSRIDFSSHALSTPPLMTRVDTPEAQLPAQVLRVKSPGSLAMAISDRIEVLTECPNRIPLHAQAALQRPVPPLEYAL